MLTQSFSHHHHDLSSSRMTTSLVVTPPMHSQPSQPTSSAQSSRPKLSLNTSQARTFGKGSSLRLETLSAVSPTTINTFANAYEPQKTPSTATGRLARPKLSIDSSVSSATGNPETSEGLDSRTPSSSSASSASTLNSATIPYSISQVLNSVLANSPLQPRAQARRMSQRPRFPAKKTVSFRTPLVEEIVNTRYTLADVDFTILESSDSGSSISLSSADEDSYSSSSSGSVPSTDSYSESTLSLEQPTDDSISSLALKTSASLRQEFPIRGRRLPHRPKAKRGSPRTGDKRDSSSESDSDTCPETPVAGRRKRRREWVWTLGALPGQPADEAKFEGDHTDNDMTSTSTSTDFPSSASSTTYSDQSS